MLTPNRKGKRAIFALCAVLMAISVLVIVLFVYQIAQGRWNWGNVLPDASSESVSQTSQ